MISKRFIYKFFPILLFIFLLANCRDSSDIVVSEQHFTEDPFQGEIVARILDGRRD